MFCFSFHFDYDIFTVRCMYFLHGKSQSNERFIDQLVSYYICIVLQNVPCQCDQVLVQEVSALESVLSICVSLTWNQSLETSYQTHRPDHGSPQPTFASVRFFPANHQSIHENFSEADHLTVRCSNQPSRFAGHLHEPVGWLRCSAGKLG